MILYFFGGVLTWTFLEYAIHAWMGHKGKGKNPFSRDHLKHHADPRYFASAQHKAMAAIPILGATGALLSWIANGAVAAGFVGGWALMYIVYEVIHRRTHTHPPRGAYGRWTRLNHLNHHFRSPRYNHGVTTPLFDYLFGTHKPLEKCRVPARHAMDWLVDPDSGQVKPQFADDYELIGGIR